MSIDLNIHLICLIWKLIFFRVHLQNTEPIGQFMPSPIKKLIPTWKLMKDFKRPEQAEFSNLPDRLIKKLRSEWIYWPFLFDD